MEVQIEPVCIGQKSVLRQMMELYLYDFSEFSHADIKENGYFGYAYLDAYWQEAGRFPFFIRADGRLAGFILVRSCSEHNALRDPHNIAEFFVLKKYRRHGIGREAACQVFDRFPGGWEVTQWGNNLPAQAFWQKVIAQYTGGEYRTFSVPEAEVSGFTFYHSAP